MKKSFLIARSNLRRAKGQTVAIIALMLVAAFMLNLWLMLSMDYKQNFGRYHDKLNAEHVTFVVSGSDARLREHITETLEGDARTVQYGIDDAFAVAGSFGYNGGEVSTELVILEKQAALNRPVGRVEIVEDGGFTSGIYLPMLYGVDHSISAGQTVEITMGSTVERYTVCGFFNSVMAGSHNCAMSELLLTADQYEKLKEKGSVPESTLVSVRIEDKDESQEFEAMLKNAVSSEFPALLTVSNSYAMVASSRYISQMICSGIVSAMAFFVLLITLAMIASNVINYIQENMKNLGVLKAIGYRGRQIVFVLLLQFLGITLVATGVGIGLSYCIFPALNTMMVSQTGIPYAMRFLPLPCGLTVLLAGGAVALAVWLSARRIKKIEPIVALRQGIQTHNFKHNHVPLEKTRMPLQFALACKATLSGMKQNATVCITMLVLSLIVVFSGVMVENVIVDIDPFVNLIAGEAADSCININTELEGEFLEEMVKEERVRKVYLYHTTEVRHVGGIALMATLSDDFTKLNNQGICVEGRYPEYDNEVAVAAKYARETGIGVGDEITLTADGNEAGYIISGFTQTSNNLGKDCLLTRSGYERMGRLQNASYYLNLGEGADIAAFNEEVSARLGSAVNMATDIVSVVKGAVVVYVSLMTIIVAAILVLCVLIITFVLYLLVRTMLNNKKRDYGIMKALGFTTGQLMLQTAISFMPAVVISMIVGTVASCSVINPLIAVFLSGIGIVKCNFAVPVGLIAVVGIGLVVYTFGIACVLSMKIKRIAVKELVVGE